MEINVVKIDKPDEINFILGQSHFIKTVEDLHESMIDLAKKNALSIGAGHSFILFLAEGYYPLNILNAVKTVPEVVRIFCATANPTEVLVAQTVQGRGVLGVIDGFSPKGIEKKEDIIWRKALLRKIGYKS